MRKTALLLPFLLLLTACGGNEAPAPSGPSYLSNDVEGWAKNITQPELRRRETELNRLALGRIEVIPILMALLDHEDMEVVFGAFSALEGNLAKVERANADPAPWIPVLEKAATNPDESISRTARALLEKHRR